MFVLFLNVQLTIKFATYVEKETPCIGYREGNGSTVSPTVYTTAHLICRDWGEKVTVNFEKITSWKKRS
jgi:hypothetical protein